MSKSPEGARAALAVELVPIADLVPDPRNARLHPERHIKQLARSVEAFGFNCPVLVDRGNRVIAGHGRLLAVKHLSWQEVPVIRLEHLTPEQIRAFAIADNRLTDVSSWDEKLLAEQLKELSEADLDFDLEAIGFEMPEIDLRIQSLGDMSDEPDESPGSGVDDGPAVSVLGDVWQLGRHRIACGSALDLAAYETLLETSRAAMVFTDPPYNVPITGHVSGNGGIQHREFAMASGEMSQADFTDFLGQSLAAMKRILVPGALLYVCMDWRHLRELSSAGDAQQLELKNLAVWDKGCGGMGSLYRSQHELVFVFKAGTTGHTNNVQLGRFGRNRSNIWSYPGVNSFARQTGEGNLLALHPTVKPLALVADAILDASERGDIVLDPFLGSGTTVIAAEKTGRVGVGIELDPRYVDTGVRRWQRMTGHQAIHAATGQAFDAIAHARSVAGLDSTFEPARSSAMEGA
jgi:DNA modification methylase